MKVETLFSSATDEWETPKDFFDALNDEFHFDLDVSATEQNAKCERFFSREQDGLMQEWNGTVWCNPPYGSNISRWMQKAYESNATVVCLVPARTDTKWFHDWVLGKAEIRFVKGRLRFGGSKYNAPFPSMIVVYRRREEMTVDGKLEYIRQHTALEANLAQLAEEAAELAQAALKLRRAQGFGTPTTTTEMEARQALIDEAGDVAFCLKLVCDRKFDREFIDGRLDYNADRSMRRCGK